MRIISFAEVKVGEEFKFVDTSDMYIKVSNEEAEKVNSTYRVRVTAAARIEGSSGSGKKLPVPGFISFESVRVGENFEHHLKFVQNGQVKMISSSVQDVNEATENLIRAAITSPREIGLGPTRTQPGSVNQPKPVTITMPHGQPTPTPDPRLNPELVPTLGKTEETPGSDPATPPTNDPATPPKDPSTAPNGPDTGGDVEPGQNLTNPVENVTEVG